uniref:Ice-binding protein C-terminal domain-containing protein n=1 Tax=Geobacter sp. (strain M21) TaxID=443144 RepID=C6E7W0_GEOSM
MKRLTVITLLAWMMLLGTTAASSATVLTFDEIKTTGDNQIDVPDGYGGLTWQNIWATNTDDETRGPGYRNGTVSGSIVAFNADGRPGTISDRLFDFNGAYLTAAWNNGLNIQVQGYRGGNLAYDRTVVVDTTAPTFFLFDYAGVDRLTFDSFGGTNAGYGGVGFHFAMDNFTFNETTPIPEPSTFLLLGAGIMAVACLRKGMTRSQVR